MTKSADISIPIVPYQQQVEFQAADLIVSYIEQLGVEYVFGVPGGAIEPLYNALSRSARRGGVRPVVARHESGAAFMADGYARETGRIGVCCATTGPGATNMITGVASAYQDNIPMLAITAQTPLASFGLGAVQESSCTAVNTVGMFQYCTHYNSLVSHPDQVEYKLISALTAAYQNKGPVHLSIPLDILRMPLQETSSWLHVESLFRELDLVDDNTISAMLLKLKCADKIVMVVGEGCSDGIANIIELARTLGALIVATPQGKGLVDPYLPNFRGVCGLAGHASAKHLLVNADVDLVLLIGSNLDQQATQGWGPSENSRAEFIHIDSVQKNFARSPYARLHVGGNIKKVFKCLVDQLDCGPGLRETRPPWDQVTTLKDSQPVVIKFERRQGDRRNLSARNAQGTMKFAHVSDKRVFERRRGGEDGERMFRNFALDDEVKYLINTSPIKPQRLMYDLSRLFPENTRFLADIGNSFLWGIHYLHPVLPVNRDDRTASKSFFRTSMGFASMGWAIGSAVGTALANPRDPVVCIVGDGSFLMGGQEITTAVTEKLGVVFVILNDQALGTVKFGQQLAGAEPVGFELPPVDFAMFARSMGVGAYTIRSPDDLAALDIAAICRRQGPTLLDVYIEPDEAPPLYERMNMLAISN